MGWNDMMNNGKQTVIGKKHREWRKPSPTQIITLGFAIVIATGTLLLTLPIASADGRSIGGFDALFTATSGTCVTGLSVMDVGTRLSTFGQVVLLLMIQVGGLGFMAVTTLFQLIAGKRIGLRERLLLKESLNENGVGGMVGLMRWALISTFTIEIAGALLLAVRMIPLYGPGRGLYYALFHSVSAYYNAGFDLIGLGQSYVRFQHDPVVQLTTILLVLFGGLGFGVQRDLCRNRFHFSKCRLQTKVVLAMTLFMTLLVTMFIAAAEWGNPNTLADMNVLEKGMNALFQSVTLRTAGYATVDQAALRNASKLFCCIWMFVGAAPASTGGGVKVTTFALLLLMMRSTMQGRSEVTAFKRTLPRDLVRRGVTLVTISMSVLLMSTLALSLTESGQSLADVLFLCTSALATVGLSAFDCALISTVGRAVIIVLMFMGRVGPLTMALALARRQSATGETLRYPEDRMMIG